MTKQDKQRTREIKAKQRETLRDIKSQKKNLKKQRKQKNSTFKSNKVIRENLKNTLESVPYVRMYEKGMVELLNGRYSKTYKFDDISYRSAKDEDRHNIFIAYTKFLNSISSDVDVQLHIANKKVNIKEVHDLVFAQKNNKNIGLADELGLVEEFNDVMKSDIEKGENTKRTERFITVSLEATNAKFANDRFKDIEAHMTKKFKDISDQCNLHPLNGNELSHAIASIYRQHMTVPQFAKEDFKLGKERSYIAPDGLEIKANYLMIGERYAKCLFLRDIPPYVTDELIADLFSSDIEMCVSINIKPLDTMKVRRRISRSMTDLQGKQATSQQAAAKKMIFADLTPKNILESIEAANELEDFVKNKKQSVFMFNMIIMFYADTLEDMKIKEMSLQSKAGGLIFSFGPLIFQQERALQSVLPIGFNNLSIGRTLTTEATATFIPFDRKSTLQKGGFLYSLHADTKQAIVLNRSTLKNQSGFVLGSSGSGKGMMCKGEMLNVIFKTNDDIIIIDPENEYSRFVRMFGGTIIELSSTTKDHINPFDIPLEDEEFASGTPAASLKLGIILNIIENMLGGEMHPTIRSIDYGEWKERKDNNSWKEELKTDIDRGILLCDSFDEWKNFMLSQGYEFKEPRKHLTMRKKVHERFVRTNRLGAKYTRAQIEKRLLAKDKNNIRYKGDSMKFTDFISMRKLNTAVDALIALQYLSVLEIVFRLIVNNMFRNRIKFDIRKPYNVMNDLVFRKLLNQYNYIERNNIKTIPQLHTLSLEYPNVKTLDDISKVTSSGSLQQNATGGATTEAATELPWQKNVKIDIDLGVSMSSDFEEWKNFMKRMGYEFKEPSKHLSMRKKGYAKFINVGGLGSDYTESKIKDRLLTSKYTASAKVNQDVQTVSADSPQQNTTDNNKSWQQMVKNDIDQGVLQCNDFNEWKEFMLSKGYEFEESSEHLSMRKKGYAKFIKADRLGSEYTKNKAKERLSATKSKTTDTKTTTKTNTSAKSR